MQISTELVQLVTRVTWTLGLFAVSVCFFSYAFSDGLFKPPTDRLKRGSIPFWIFTGGILLLLGSALVGSSICLWALVELDANLCRTLGGTRLNRTFAYYLVPAWLVVMLYALFLYAFVPSWWHRNRDLG